MRKPHRNGHYPTPYTAVLEVDGVWYVIVDRRRHGFRAVALTKAETKLVRDALDNVQADTEERLAAARRRPG